VSIATVTATRTTSVTPRLLVKGFVFSFDYQRTIMVDIEITDPLTIAEIQRDLITKKEH
jgi:hypothetical protein